MVRQFAQGGCDWSREVTGDPLQLATANYFTRILDAQRHVPSYVRFQVIVNVLYFETVTLLEFMLTNSGELGLALRMNITSM